MTYRYQHFTPAVVLDELRAIGSTLRPGSKLPRFALPTIDGGQFDSDDPGNLPMLIAVASFT